jgi:hypothetical protein
MDETGSKSLKVVLNNTDCYLLIYSVGHNLQNIKKIRHYNIYIRKRPHFVRISVTNYVPDYVQEYFPKTSLSVRFTGDQQNLYLYL